jgi:hypothetical protein
MRKGGKRSLWLWSLLLVSISMPLIVGGQSTQHMAPTNSQDAQTIDETWQRASSKYDSERNAILKEVRRAANEVPAKI